MFQEKKIYIVNKGVAGMDLMGLVEPINCQSWFLEPSVFQENQVKVNILILPDSIVQKGCEPINWYSQLRPWLETPSHPRDLAKQSWATYNLSKKYFTIFSPAGVNFKHLIMYHT